MNKGCVAILFIGIGCTLLCTLGFWQLSRYHEKQHLLNQAGSAAAQPPQTASALLADTRLPKQRRFTHLTLTTLCFNEYTILLDNKLHKGQAGYHVLVPAALNEDTLILINRGWIPLGGSRKTLPHPEPLIGEVLLSGYLNVITENTLLSRAIETDHIAWPLRMQYVDIGLIGQLTGKKIYPLELILDADSPFTLVCPPKPFEWLTPDRHLGYAVQWFALALTLLLLSLRFVRKREPT